MDQNTLFEDEGVSVEARDKAARKSTIVSVVVNSGLTVVQVITGIVANSQGMIADGIHSLSDLLADFVVLLASHHSKQAPDERHHYGHQRYENAASLILGVMLLVVGVGMLWAAVHKLQTPEQIAPVHISALWVAGIALVAKETLFRYMLRIAQQVRSGMLVANAWHARSDAASSFVVGLGICGNLAGYPLLDPIAALVVGLMVSKMGWSFAWDALHDLMDGAADDAEIEQIKVVLLATPGVQGLHDLKTRKTGDMILVDVHLEVDATITVQQGHDIAVQARKAVMQALPVLNVMTHLDPVGHVD
ncbi:cation diffusion facilitator family transporter [Leeia oryzae]|uniref:cation diffusion facilitator family transporter n=1 Tax=Leeia oryzae TaxID=356662 RepID=UPI00035CF18A|nr:cation diffusion facilitator family transporter [Leeia oryzae]